MSIKPAAYALLLSLLATPAIWGADEQAADIYRATSPSIFIISVRSGDGSPISFGTGFLIGKSRLATNWHVIQGGTPFLEIGAVRLPAEMEARDEINDLAIVSVREEIGAQPLRLASKPISPGESVFVIGNPEGLEKSITTGVVSGIRDVNGRKLIQISAPISPGSSGGPVLNSSGEVVGITVGTLTDGQNLNFAVPVLQLSTLLTFPKPSGTLGMDALLKDIEDLETSESKLEYSADEKSEYQRLHIQIVSKLAAAVDQAGSDPAALIKVAADAGHDDIDIQITAARAALKLKPTVEANYLIGNGLETKFFFAKGDDIKDLARRAAEAFRAGIQLGRPPDPKLYLGLANAFEELGSIQEAQSYFHRAFEGESQIGNESLRAASIRGLIRAAYALDRPKEGDIWFKKLLETGSADAWDWDQQGDRQSLISAYREAAASYERAASLDGDYWRDWCDAASYWSVVPVEYAVTASPLITDQNPGDLVLADARKCVSAGVGQKESEQMTGRGHQLIAEVLVARGVFDQALHEAREATELLPSDARSFSTLADAFFGLRRFDETVTASKRAIALSDGKFSSLHFRLGSAYFELQDWELARQSFEKAAELETGDTAAPYNVALCLLRLGYKSDAIRWYREVLRRDPKYPDRAEIEKRIAWIQSTTQ
ncbi:MAG: tetratricopeptide repeat-containing serine protease family protein [Bryobacteraceae bacterium]